MQGEVDSIGLPRLTAFHNVAASVDATAFLPRQVFAGAWDGFLFFEADRMFAPFFAEVMIEFIHAEHATSCCLLNFSQTSTLEYQEAAAVFLEEGVTGSDYDSRLRNGGPAEGWLFAMDRYGCASDKGEWCIYCEKANEIAIIGLRYPSGAEKLASPLMKLRASPIGPLVQMGPNAPPPYKMLTPEWREGLINNYSTCR